MDDTIITSIVAGIGVALALGIVARRGKKLEPSILKELQDAGGVLTLPELVKRIGLKDSFMNRGKVIQAIAPMVSRGEVVEIDDPNATVKNRLELKQFRLK
ncbi:hypothetical protein LFX25_20270 [Leptospira sp. FAT2]|uniref:hypothetical protein n=1 Tax=Leptospira sanjuanensis TaxID=2879643 RepID=UPI001EE8C83D|nr:hypothetical protein [Leptospira sanjuanensis]MCG6169773.1 hypothetical protein [Leptospira sanjuanensis]MCG6195581.1 hypothetical protein [Leptospira sanjuanensis]